MRVLVSNRGDERFKDIPGTIIDLNSRGHSFDCLVEFDEYVHGHAGLGWGTVEGKDGHCYWFYFGNLEEIDVPEETPLEDCHISYDDLF